MTWTIPITIQVEGDTLDDAMNHASVVVDAINLFNRFIHANLTRKGLSE